MRALRAALSLRRNVVWLLLPETNQTVAGDAPKICGRRPAASFLFEGDSLSITVTVGVVHFSRG